MEKQYQGLRTLVKKFGLREAIAHKFLELRDKSPLADKLFPGPMIGHINSLTPSGSSSTYSGSYIAQWDSKGKLAYFNPNPNYPEDFRPIDVKTHQPVRRLTDEELLERTPTEFAHTMSQILRN